jgi:hypothetical protein
MSWKTSKRPLTVKFLDNHIIFGVCRLSAFKKPHVLSDTLKL